MANKNQISMKRLLCSFLFIAITTDAVKILGIFPRPAKSQFIFHESLMKILAFAGHNVTIIAPYPLTTPIENFTSIYRYINHSLQEKSNSISSFKSMSGHQLRNFNLNIIEKYCYDITELEEIQEALKSEEKLFDIMFVELMMMHECYLPIAQKLNIPVVGTTSVRDWIEADNAIGNGQNPAVHPFIMSHVGKKMTFYQRIVNIIDNVIWNIYYHSMELPRLKRFYKRFYPEIQSKISKKVSLVFYNNHPSIFSRTVGPNSINIGGIRVKTVKMKPLPDNIVNFIEESENGVILFTFGSIINSKVISTQMKNLFKEVFAEIPQRVIWKFEENVEGFSNNVLLQKWVHQKEILSHKNVIAFISHGGIGGMYEAVYTGKPVIMIPFFADQFSNSIILEELGVGIYLDIEKLTKKQLLNAINEVINNTNYVTNMQKLSKAFQDDPMPLDKTIVYWTEYVLRHNGSFHLRTTDADMPLYQYLLLDIIVFVVIILAIVIFFLYVLIKKLFRFFFTIRLKFVSIKNKKKD